MRRFAPSTTAPLGAEGNFVALYEQTLDNVYSYVFSRVRHRAVAEDLTQEVFLAGARRVGDGAVVDLPWLIAVARHKIVDHWRAQEREQHKIEMVTGDLGSEVMDDPSSFDAGHAAEVLQALNPTYRIALVLRHVDGLAVGEVAAHLGRSIEAAEQILTRARATFRVAYSGGNR